MDDRDREPTDRVRTRPPPALSVGGESGIQRRVAVPTPACVLVVGGQPDEAAFMAMALRRRDHAVHCVRTASEALRLARHETFDVVVARGVLPDANAQALFREIRHHDPRVRTIVLHDGPAPEEGSAEGGADGALRRPVPVVALVQTVERLLTER